ncbi:AAA family ATPase, partial [Candidatus Woesearchaeota archaeon]|nr:AAA family ATPase [Candidatus Woesearchaeota archaeon]
INDPELLILDEPTHNLDFHTAEKLRRFLVELNKKKKTTVIFTSHNVQEVEKVAKTVGFMKSGKLVQMLSLAQIKKKYGSLQKFMTLMGRKDKVKN